MTAPSVSIHARDREHAARIRTALIAAGHEASVSRSRAGRVWAVSSDTAPRPVLEKVAKVTEPEPDVPASAAPRLTAKKKHTYISFRATELAMLSECIEYRLENGVLNEARETRLRALLAKVEG